ncbi:MAG: nucleoside monophosphate kinase [Actinobacteria bacterium]|nr:nucleoside monophosphate kinase [Actinomycetota bacterium]
MIRLVLFGRQGAGKGTQAVMLSEHYKAPHISTGDMLREAVAEGTAVGQKVMAILDAGELVPDETMLEVIHDRLAHDDVEQHGFLLDGFPRTVGQAKSLLKIATVDLGVNLEVPERLVLERISSRRVCQQGHIYSVNDDAAREGVCPIDSTLVEQRDDDTPEAVTARLDAYKMKTAVAMAYFDSQGLLLSVDGVGEPEAVFRRLVEAIDARLDHDDRW